MSSVKQNAADSAGTHQRAEVSFVVPTLNSGSTLDAALGSLRSQLGVDVNILVADSGSTDETLDICKRWKVPSTYVPPGNLYRAVNAGLREFRTEWLGYLNSDDWIYTDSLLRLTNHGQATTADVVYGNCDYSDSAGRFMFSFSPARPRRLDSLFRLGIMGFAQPATLFRRHTYQSVGGFDETFKLASDAVFFMNASNAGARFTYLGGPSVASFRLHPGQLTQMHGDQRRLEADALRSLAGRGPVITDYGALLGWRLANAHHYALRLLRAPRSHRS